VASVTGPLSPIRLHVKDPVYHEGDHVQFVRAYSACDTCHEAKYGKLQPPV